MAVLCGMPTVQYSARSTWLSVRLSKWVGPKTASGHRRRRRTVQCYSTGDGNVFSHEGTLAPPGEYDWSCASFGPLEFTTETANGSVQPFLHILRQKVPIMYNRRPYPPELPLPMVASGRHVIRDSLGPRESGTQMATWSFQLFLQGSLVWQTDQSDRQTDTPR